MDTNELLILGLLETVLGKGKRDRNTANYTFYCPVCNHHKPKLVININTGQYNCWTCHPKTKGSSPISLLKKLQVSKDKLLEMKSYFKSDITRINDIKNNDCSLPKEFKSLIEINNSIETKLAISYLKKRGVNESDILKHNIGYCESGRYKDKIIIPSYNSDGILNYFIARSYKSTTRAEYDAPQVKKNDIIGFENFINWNVPIILCEGAFDAIAIKRNAIPLFGKTIPKSLMLKLVKSEVKTIYLALDKDALKEALTYSENLLNLGKEVYLIELEGKDPSDLGFDNMINLLQKAKPITISNILLKKINSI